jgi:hypothetical protein
MRKTDAYGIMRRNSKHFNFNEPEHVNSAVWNLENVLIFVAG